MKKTTNLTDLVKPFKDQYAKDSYFVSFEGIEGSGKTTQINLLKEDLITQGYKVLLLREPGGTHFGEKLREVILTSNEKISPLSEALLFASSRAQLLENKILPFLSQPKHIVIIDRYIDSSIAYQGFARKLGVETILKIHHHSPLNILPNLTFYLDINLNLSMQRQRLRGQNKDYFEKEDQDFYQELINGYEFCVENFKSRVKVIAADNTIENVAQQIKTHLGNLL
ncbi:MAG: dTMP kinase [Bacteriovoracaceae bacterium]|jgi:dTMP kinase|nr:dTMP kinase [Halobacteriovoraceae bacterium]MDP7319999.1 dTMP kinase [Bacteriovoracaceae bacterium]|tara:strand:+ start:339 stop:1016 length:678 start_codon:yes stop_codon:yes gene_type:complete